MKPELASIALQLIGRANISAKEAEAVVAVKQALLEFIPKEAEAPEEKKDKK
jgi:hypothetical protein